MEFGYDFSRLQRTHEIVGSSDFTSLAATGGASCTAREYARVQEAHAAARVCERRLYFQNPDPARDRVPEGVPASAGALDRAGLKGPVKGPRACRRRTPIHRE